MAFRSVPTLQRTALRAAVLLLANSLAAQAQAQATQTITVSGRSAGSASIAGFGDVPLAKAPFSATVINAGALQDAGINGIADLTRLDAGITDAYNAPGYWGQLAVRGFTLDNRFNYRRDGLPINAETVIAQPNKQAIEILKGTSGLQAGTSAPGGLVNLIVKRPRDAVTSASLHWEQDGTVGAALDLGRRSGGFGWRINASADHLDPQTNSSRGQRGLLAGAAEWQLAPGSLLEAELEWSRQSQPSTPGVSLLGDRLPDARSIDPRINLNNQAWSLPVVLRGATGSLRYTQELDRDTQVVAHAMRQRLDSDDRIAFPYGFYPNATPANRDNPDLYYDCGATCDRYNSDGRFSYWDFRSDGERRTSDALSLAVQGRATLGGLAHSYRAGMLTSRYRARFNGQAFNLIEQPGTIDGKSAVNPAPDLYDANTNRDERSTEWQLQDAVTLSPQWSLWAGLRHTRLQRESVRVNTGDLRATHYTQSFTTPWLAISHALTPQGQAYLSWGQGIESEVAPGRSRYSNAGQALPALKSRQVELGYKHSAPTLDWRVAAFDIRRPAWRDIGACNSTINSCSREIDGEARHRGVEAEADWRTGPLNLRASAMVLQARREGSTDPTLNGLRPTNVPARSLKLQAAYNLADVPGLALLAFVTHEGNRRVLPLEDVNTPAWTRLDLGARYSQRLGGSTVVWRAGIDNLTNRRAWQEAAYQFEHAYLYPLAPRTLHASAQLSF
jgi:iron complex outermembrane receptor protein